MADCKFKNCKKTAVKDTGYCGDHNPNKSQKSGGGNTSAGNGYKGKQDTGGEAHLIRGAGAQHRGQSTGRR
jgi:hypothetical protein